MAEARDEDFSGTRILWGSRNTSKFLEFQALFSSNSPISVPCNLFYSVEACNYFFFEFKYKKKSENISNIFFCQLIYNKKLHFACFSKIFCYSHPWSVSFFRREIQILIVLTPTVLPRKQLSEQETNFGEG
jgi:hypothetical protein